MINEKEAQSNATLKNLEHLFHELDKSGDGCIDKEEFEVLKSNSQLKTWFSALEVDLGDIDELFLLLDNGHGEITRQEFVDGIKAMRGMAKKTDILEIKRRLRKIDSNLDDLYLRNITTAARSTVKKHPVKRSARTLPLFVQQMCLSDTTVDI